MHIIAGWTHPSARDDCCLLRHNYKATRRRQTPTTWNISLADSKSQKTPTARNGRMSSSPFSKSRARQRTLLASAKHTVQSTAALQHAIRECQNPVQRENCSLITRHLPGLRFGRLRGQVPPVHRRSKLRAPPACSTIAVLARGRTPRSTTRHHRQGRA